VEVGERRAAMDTKELRPNPRIRASVCAVQASKVHADWLNKISAFSYRRRYSDILMYILRVNKNCRKLRNTEKSGERSSSMTANGRN